LIDEKGYFYGVLLPQLELQQIQYQEPWIEITNASGLAKTNKDWAPSLE
jgi:hypothetical protein